MKIKSRHLARADGLTSCSDRSFNRFGLAAGTVWIYNASVADTHARSVEMLMLVVCVHLSFVVPFKMPTVPGSS